MSDRVIRDEILESVRWLSLKDNADRLAFLVLLLRCDTLGNVEGHPVRLMRMWRDFGIATEPLVAKCLSELADHDLVRMYEVDGKRFIHIPRFRQTRRYLGRLNPLSPWTTEQEKQDVAKYSHSAHREHAQSAPGAPPVRTAGMEGFGMERKGLRAPKSQPVDNSAKVKGEHPAIYAANVNGKSKAKPAGELAIVATGKAIGVAPLPGESMDAYRVRVQQAKTAQRKARKVPA